VRTSLWADSNTPIPHTRLGQEADLVVVAPATARLISAYASGYSHDLLNNVLIATRAPVLLCPAMHTEMWEHPAVQDNIATLRSRGVGIVGPGVGHLAGGDSGAGRLAEPVEIFAAAEAVFDEDGQWSAGGSRDMAGVRVLVTAGGTREAIDPVRFLGNRSSGKQGHAVAEVARRRGADVVLVTTAKLPVAEGIEVLEVESAREMYDAVTTRAPASDVVVMAAAVADFRPAEAASDKIKKRDGAPGIELVPTEDILLALGSAKPAGQVLVGFAAETNDPVANGMEKLAAKKADLLVVNDVGAPDVGFEHETNEVMILSPGGQRHVPLADKASVAGEILDAAMEIRSDLVAGTDKRTERS
jgi:phosphopantothenoylcysteine decarboxylase/phosphopantothenate--cysteine ligase